LGHSASPLLRAAKARLGVYTMVVTSPHGLYSTPRPSASPKTPRFLAAPRTRLHEVLAAWLESGKPRPTASDAFAISLWAAGVIRVTNRMPIVGEDGAALSCCASVTEVLCCSSSHAIVRVDRAHAICWVGRRAKCAARASETSVVACAVTFLCSACRVACASLPGHIRRGGIEMAY